MLNIRERCRERLLLRKIKDFYEETVLHQLFGKGVSPALNNIFVGNKMDCKRSLTQVAEKAAREPAAFLKWVANFNTRVWRGASCSI